MSNIAFNIAVGVILAGIGWCIMMLYRNNWVYNIRMKWIDDETVFTQWKRAPTYKQMLHTSWKWSTDFESWAKPREPDPTYLSKVRPEKAGQADRFKRGE